MRTFLLVLGFLSFFSKSVSASELPSMHEYFFAFAELSFNDESKRFEVTLDATAHDVVLALRQNGVVLDELENHYHDTILKPKLESFLNEGFTVKINEQKANFQLDGFEVLPNGLVSFFLSSQVFETRPTSIDVKFDFLMKSFPNQQNKLLFRKKNETVSAVFLEHKPTQQITIP